MNGVPFAKWEGLGNDFVLVDAREDFPHDPVALARAVCAPHFGIGADGLVLLRENGSGLEMHIYNADGSVAATCGNALRCLALYTRREGLSGDEVAFRTPSGVRRARVLGNEVEVDMGPPEAAPGRVETPYGEGWGVSMGNPHLVIFVDRAVPLHEWGPEMQTAGPLGEVNVEFTRVMARDHLVVQVYERGAGATLACGSGACAALAAAVWSDRAEREARVDLPGGTLRLKFSETILMRGPARELYRGIWRPDP